MGGGSTGGGYRGEPPPRLALRERFGALRNLPPFFRMIWRTNRRLTTASLVLRLVRALCSETHETWLEDNRYINMDDLREHKKLELRKAA